MAELWPCQKMIRSKRKKAVQPASQRVQRSASFEEAFEPLSENSIEDTEGLINAAGVLSALALAFVVPLISQLSYNDMDRVNFREAYYDVS